jgi:hypothetical protein
MDKDKTTNRQTTHTERERERVQSVKKEELQRKKRGDVTVK